MLGMEQMYKMALDPRIYPDARLLSIMQGKDQSLPMAVAMAAKQQRDKLKTAGAGEQAQQGAKQPSVKDQMLAKDLPPEHSGLAALPAENMHDMGSEQMMAGGGIVAFSGLEDSLVEQAKSDDDAKNEWLQNAKKNPPAPATPSWLDRLPTTLADKRSAATDTAIAQANADAAAQDKVAGVATPTGQTNPLAITPQQQAVINANNANNPIKPSDAATNAATNAAQPQAGIGEPPKRVDRFAGLGETQEAFDKKLAAEQNAGKSEFLMNMGLKMMTTVGPLGKAIGEGGIAGLPSLSASRKTVRELEKNRTDYQLNMAKAQTAADQGDDELSLKYKTLAEQSAYHSGLLAVERTKAGAYANSVGTKQDAADQRRESSIMGIAKGLLEKNMKYNMPNTSPADRQAMEQAAIDSAVNMYKSSQSAINGKAEIGSGYSMSDIDAAIARKQKQS